MPERAGGGRALKWFASAAAVAVLDFLSKLAVLASLAPGERVPLTGFLNLVLVFNKGAAFSFLAAQPGWQTPLFAAIALGASGFISWLLWRQPQKILFCTGLALILGGALGNLYDRLVYGHVVDFVDLHVAGWHWPAFNLADSGISVGAVLLIIESFVQREEAPRGKSA
jgi:signal peptidase II